MANIPLRSYNREIENLIDRGQTEEATAHCKHILQFYPKHIDTYRLLGKAYLESQRYTEAADIFQRILSSFPDDFICQVGMSIIREDEGNLDAAIAHMERAFEVQPSNSAVQEELRRLYGRRDGVEPTRVRLTRGSLARMYARGDLYHQAISEISSALNEDPQRLDLQVLLARMHYQAGQKFEAVELCSSLIDKFPYCFEANRILAEILPGTNTGEDTQVYQQRVYALDPYMAFCPPESNNPVDVPDNAVAVERLEWDPSRGESLTPAWSSPLVSPEEKSATTHKLPDWLASLSPVPSPLKLSHEPVAPESDTSTPAPVLGPVDLNPPAESVPVTPVEPFTADTSATEIPAWMKDAGWAPSTSPEQPSSDLNSEDQEPAEAQASDDIPEWLRSLAPAGDIPSPSEEQPSGDDLSWLNDLASNPIAQNAENAETPSSDAIPGIPDWLNFSQQGTESHDETGEQPAQPLANEEQIPSWLQNLQSTAGETAQSESAGQTTDQDSPTISTEMPAWLQESQPLSTSEPSLPQPTSDDEGQTTISWLESIAAKHSSEAETLIARPEDRLANPPDWIKQPAEPSSSWVKEDDLSPEDHLSKETLTAETPEPVVEEETIAGDQQSPIVASDLTDLSSPVEPSSLDSASENFDEQYVPEPNQVVEQTSETPEPSASAPGELPEWLKMLENNLPSDTPETVEPAAPAETLGAPIDNQAAEPAAEPAGGFIQDISSEIPDWAKQPEDQPEHFEYSPEPAAVEESAASAPTPEWFDTVSESEVQQAEPEPSVTPSPVSPTGEQSSPSEPTVDAGDETPDQSLYTAQMSLLDGKIGQALEAYSRLISSGDFLDETIHDLRDALYRYPIDVSIWQTLGDAYIRANRVQEALDAYTKAEELIR